MKAIILAAGKGTRIQDYTLGEPKSLIEINGISILEHTLKALLKQDIEINIVIGHRRDLMISSIQKMGLESYVKTILNDKFGTTGTAYSLFKGLEAIVEKNEDNVLVIEADVIFEEGILQSLTTKFMGLNVTMLEKFYEGLEGSFVELDDKNCVVDWTHSDMRSDKDPVEHLYKTINIHRFTNEFIKNILFPKLKFLLSLISSGNQSLERVFREIIKENPGVIKGIDNGRQFLWQEVDYKDDLNLAFEKFKAAALC